jgi:hypothetical protein
MLGRVASGTASTFLEISNGGWSAIAAWAGLLLVAVAALVAFFQLRLGQRLRAEQAQPYVVIYAEHNEAHPHCIELSVKNFGATAARDITITIDPPLQRSAGGEIEDVKGPNQIRTLVPGQEWRTFWDTTIHREELSMPSRYTATIKFSDSRGRKLGPYTFDLDWGQMMDRGWIETYGIHQLAEAVRETRDLLKNRGDHNHMRVLAYSGEGHDKRERESWEKRRQQREREQREGEGEGEGDDQKPSDENDSS